MLLICHIEPGSHTSQGFPAATGLFQHVPKSHFGSPKSKVGPPDWLQQLLLIFWSHILCLEVDILDGIQVW